MTSDTLVVLVHGFCRHGHNMHFWRDQLSDVFPDIAVADMPATHKSFERCLESLSRTFEEAQASKYKQVFIAGHSMGGLLAREYLAKNRPANVKKLVCVGTPHLGSRLADLALILGFPWSGIVFPPLWALRCAARKKITTPDLPDLEIGVIVSENNAHWPGKLFLSSSADGLVENKSALAADAKSHIILNVPHDPMQYDSKIAQAIKNFFVKGNFEDC